MSLPDFYKMNSIVWVDAISSEQNEYLINNMNGTLESLNNNLDRLKHNKCDKEFYKRIINKFIETCDARKYYFEKTNDGSKNTTNNKNLTNLIKILDVLQTKFEFNTKEVIEIVQNVFNHQIHCYIINSRSHDGLEKDIEIMWCSIKTQIENLLIIDHSLIISNEKLRKYLLNIKTEVEMHLSRGKLSTLLYNEHTKQVGATSLLQLAGEEVKDCWGKNSIDFYEEGEKLVIFNYLYNLLKNYL